MKEEAINIRICHGRQSKAITYLLEVLQQVSIHKTLRPLVQRAVNSDDITLRHELLQVLNTLRVDGPRCLLRERRVIEVEELFAVEGEETL